MEEKEQYVLRTIDTDKWYWCKCTNCGWEDSSEFAGGGAPLGDTGDHTDPCCPICHCTDLNGDPVCDVPTYEGEVSVKIPLDVYLPPYIKAAELAKDYEWRLHEYKSGYALRYFTKDDLETAFTGGGANAAKLRVSDNTLTLPVNEFDEWFTKKFPNYGVVPGGEWIDLLQAQPIKSGVYKCFDPNNHYTPKECEYRFDAYNKSWYDTDSDDCYHPSHFKLPAIVKTDSSALLPSEDKSEWKCYAMDSDLGNCQSQCNECKNTQQRKEGIEKLISAQGEIESQLKQLGFESLPHFNIGNSLIYQLGRRRHLSFANIATPNEMLFICELDADDDKKINDLICLRNYDYDGYTSIERIKLLITAIKTEKTTGAL